MFKRKKAKTNKETQPHYKKIIYGTLSCDVPQGFTFDENAHLVAFKVPENPTNGDIIRALFPNPTENSQYTVGEDRVYSTPNGEMHYYSISKSMQFICSTDYWNTPYKLSELKGEN